MLVDDAEVPAFVLSGKTFRRDGLSTNSLFMWTLICSMKYDRPREESPDRRRRGKYERALLKQFRRQAAYRIIYSGETRDTCSSAPTDCRLLDTFLNTEYHTLIGCKSRQFNDYIQREKHKLYPLSKRVLNLLMSLPSTNSIVKTNRADRDYNESKSRNAKYGRYGIPLLEKSKRRELASRDDKYSSESTTCIEIEDDEGDIAARLNDKAQQRKSMHRGLSSSKSNGKKQQQQQQQQQQHQQQQQQSSRHVSKRNAAVGCSKPVSEEKSATDRIAELKKMLPMIGKKPKKPVKGVKSLLEMSRSKNSVPHKPGPYQPQKDNLIPIAKVAITQKMNENKDIDMQISDESEHTEDAQPKSPTRNNLSPPPPPPPPPPPSKEAEVPTKRDLPPLPPMPPKRVGELPNPLAEPIPLPHDDKDSRNVVAASASTMALQDKHSTGVKQQLQAMAAFLNRDPTPTPVAPVENKAPVKELSAPAYNYPYPPEATYSTPVEGSYTYQEQQVAPNDYWQNYYSSQPPPPLDLSVPPPVLDTSVPPPLLDTSMPPPGGEPYADYYYSEEPQVAPVIPDVEWYDSIHVETSEYTGIEPPIPGLQRVILPPLEGIKSTIKSGVSFLIYTFTIRKY